MNPSATLICRRAQCDFATVGIAFPDDREEADEIGALGPDFPFAYDGYLTHPAGLGSIPAERHGTPVAVVGAGLAGVVTAYELMRLGLRPVVYEVGEIGGRMRSVAFPGGVVAELGAMRFPATFTSVLHYLDEVGLSTAPFPDPLAPSTPSTVVDLEGRPHYVAGPDELPECFTGLARAMLSTLHERTSYAELQAALRDGDRARVTALWAELVRRFDGQSIYAFLCESPAFASFRDREVLGQVGYGTGGWQSEYPHTILEILRLLHIAADDEHLLVVGGSAQLPQRLWRSAPARTAHWPAGTSLAALHSGGVPRPGAARLLRAGRDAIAVGDVSGGVRTFPAVVFTPQKCLLGTRVDCAESLLPRAHWTAVEQGRYVPAYKAFVAVDRPFWLDKDPLTGRDVMSATVTDRMVRRMFLFGDDPAAPGLMCLSYSVAGVAARWATLTDAERVEAVLRCLGEIYPGVDIRGHVIGEPVVVSWASEPHFMGAYKADLPGHFRYQRRLFTHFLQDRLEPRYRGLFLAGDDVSWTPGWSEGAVQTAANAVWGVLRQFGGATDPANPGPGDVADELLPGNGEAAMDEGETLCAQL